MPKGKQAKPAKAAGPLVSPLAPKSFPALPPLAGVRLGTGAAGVRYQDRTDVLLAVLAPGTQVAGVFTKSKTSSAPVDWCRDKLKGGRPASWSSTAAMPMPLPARPAGGRARRSPKRPQPWSAAARAKSSWPRPA